MGLETATTIADLNANWPLGTDPRSQGDDHLRLIKAVMQSDCVSKSGGTMTGDLTISEAEPNLHYEETDVAANVSRWAVGMYDGNYSIAPRASDGSVITGSGQLRISRTAAGVESIIFTNASGVGSITLGQAGQGGAGAFDGGDNGLVSVAASPASVRVDPTATTGSAFYLRNVANTAVQFIVRSPSGDVDNANNSYGGISDERLKTNIAPANSQMGDVLFLASELVNFDWKSGEGPRQLGVIAQRVMDRCPGLVTHDPEEDLYSVKYSLVPLKLLKAFAELHAEMQALKGGAA